MLTLLNRDLLTSPLSRFRTLTADFDRWFDSLLLPEFRSTVSAGAWVPPMEVEETDEELRCVLEVPGMRPEEIEITVEDNVLTIAGEKKAEHEASGVGYHFSERQYGRFVRRLQLPGVFDRNRVSARYENGLLIVTLPKVEEARPRRVQIEVRQPAAIGEGKVS